MWKDHKSGYEAQYPDNPELVAAMMEQESFKLPEDASFDAIHALRHEAGNGERIDKALHAVEEANGDKLRDVFQDISFNSTSWGMKSKRTTFSVT